ncbi:MAG: iron ABC transporter permease [Nitrososphaerota archaeon]|nr:iron ABC transporter permease [Candidatus Bathyarchaeota archaeon]MDW8193501.1 iron ABC transporter permease [Nitrososphaerota archaeon]
MTTKTIEELKKIYRRSVKRKVLIILSLFSAIIITMLVSVSIGAGSPRFTEAMQVIFSKLLPSLNLDPGSATTQIIVWNLRLPRVIMAIAAGAGLAASGATMQGVLRNPLVSSYILGVSAAAGFGAALATVFKIGIIISYGKYLIITNAFAFSMLAMLMVYGIARIRGITTETVILAGVAVGYLFSALLSLIQYVAPQHEAVRAIVFWLMGGLHASTWEAAIIVSPIVLLTVILMMQQSWNINITSMGEDVALSLGVNPRHVLVITMVLESLATASIIAFTGVIGFVCLISPHISRMLIGTDHRYLIPCSAIMGGLLLLCSDTVGRVILMPAEVPVGIITSLLGVPFFLYILLSKRRRIWQ